jgi:hypothetical protein
MTLTTPREPGPRAHMLKAIAIDTNAIGSGYYVHDELARLAKLADGHGAMQIWIAEPVIWEWAEHLEQAHSAMLKDRGKAVMAGIPVPSIDPLTVEEAITRITKSLQSLGPCVSIVDVRHVARAALKDQVLVQGPAERIAVSTNASTVRRKKTGAADSAIYRAYHSRALSNGDVYLLASADKDAGKAFSQWEGTAPRVVKGMKFVKQIAFALQPAPLEMVWASVDFLRENLKVFRTNLTTEEASFDDMHSEGGQVQFSTTGTPTLVGMTLAKTDSNHLQMIATVVLLTGIQVTSGKAVPDDISAPGEPAIDLAGETYESAVIHADVTFTLEDGIPQVVDIDSVSHVFATEQPGLELDESGPFELVDWLQQVPELEKAEWDEDAPGPSTKVFTVRGDELELRFEGNTYTGWQMTASFRGEVITIDGETLHDGGGYMGEFDHVRITSDYGMADRNPSTVLAAFVLNTSQKKSNEQS